MLVSDYVTSRTILLRPLYPDSARQTDVIGILLVCRSDEYIVKRELYPRGCFLAYGLLGTVIEAGFVARLSHLTGTRLR